MYCKSYNRFGVRTCNSEDEILEKNSHIYPVFEYVFQPLLDVFAFFRPDQQVKALDVRTRSEQFFHEHFAHKTRSAGQEHDRIAVELLYRGADLGLVDVTGFVEASLAQQLERVQIVLGVYDVLDGHQRGAFLLFLDVLPVQIESHVAGILDLGTVKK